MLKRKLSKFSKEDYASLLGSGMMWEFYPDATGIYYNDVVIPNEDELMGMVNSNDDVVNSTEWRIKSGQMEDGIFKEGYNFNLKAEDVSIEDFTSAMFLIYEKLGFMNDVEIIFKSPSGNHLHKIFKPDKGND